MALRNTVSEGIQLEVLICMKELLGTTQSIVLNMKIKREGFS